MQEQQILKKIAELIHFIKQLRDPEKGDPWIIEQDFSSLAAITLEETYEFAASVDAKDYGDMADELGDLLLHLFLYAELGEEQQKFTLNDMIEKTISKQKRRRANFTFAKDLTAGEALKQWDANKLKEKRTRHESILSDIPLSLPSINRAYKLQTQASQVGFDWDHVEPIFMKVNEEISEIKKEMANQNQTKILEECGDLLFTCINLCRKLEVNPDTALRHSNHKFSERFNKMERLLEKQNKKPEDLSLAELDRLWGKVK